MILWWLAAVQRRANQRVQCLNFLISQAALHCGKKPNSPPFNCQPSGHCSLWWERRSARFQNKCTPNGKSNSAVRGAVRDKDVKSNRPPHTRALRHVCLHQSAALGHERNEPLLASAASGTCRQGESLRCNTQLLRSLHNQPPGEATVEQRAAGGRKREDELLNTCFLKYSGSHMPEWATTDTDKELWLWLWWLIYSIRGK